MGSNKRFYNINGAPLQIGDEVVVTNNAPGDATFDDSFCGAKGIVVYFEYDCGCGQTYPNDPMIGVRFVNATLEEFWKEELELIHKKREVFL